jgi:hypothetical protein
MTTKNENPALKALRHHVTGAIERGEGAAIVERPVKLSKKEQEKREARESLLRFIKKGGTVYTILRHVSGSGMSRDISIVTIDASGETSAIFHPNFSAAKLLGYRLVTRNGSDALRVSGCGMDMGFHVVHSLGHALFGDGYALNHAWL